MASNKRSKRKFVEEREVATKSHAGFSPLVPTVSLLFPKVASWRSWETKVRSRRRTTLDHPKVAEETSCDFGEYGKCGIREERRGGGSVVATGLESFEDHRVYLRGFGAPGKRFEPG